MINIGPATMTFSQQLFMAEVEGYLDTREGRIQAAAKEFVQYHKDGYDINSSIVRAKVFEKFELTDITDREFLRLKINVDSKIS